MPRGYFDLEAEALAHALRHPNQKGQRERFRREHEFLVGSQGFMEHNDVPITEH